MWELFVPYPVLYLRMVNIYIYICQCYKIIFERNYLKLFLCI